MAILNRITGHDCIDEYVASAARHVESGFWLLADGDAIGVNLMGIAMEMYLKATYFSFVMAHDSDPINSVELRNAAVEARRLGVTEQHESFHNVLFWSQLVVAKRTEYFPLLLHPTSEEVAVRIASTRMRQNYDISIRYRNIQPASTLQDMQDVFEDAYEVQKHYPNLRK